MNMYGMSKILELIMIVTTHGVFFVSARVIVKSVKLRVRRLVIFFGISFPSHHTASWTSAFGVVMVK